MVESLHLLTLKEEHTIDHYLDAATLNLTFVTPCIVT